jgi:hypothetical protein
VCVCVCVCVCEVTSTCPVVTAHDTNQVGPTHAVQIETSKENKPEPSQMDYERIETQ